MGTSSIAFEGVPQERSNHLQTQVNQSAGYPRPQLKRPDWVCLNGLWKFRLDDEGKYSQPHEIAEWDQVIEVPFSPESVRSGLNENGFHVNYWYEREFDLTADAERVLLHFGAVDYQARVWVNGQYLGEHTGGYTPFTFDITHALAASGRQRVTVWVQDDPQDLAKPRGKQDWQLHPHSIWYPRTSGIWQTVWVERVAQTHIKNIRWTPHLERWEIGFEAFLAGERSGTMQLKLKLTLGDRVLVDDTYAVVNQEVHRRIALSDPGIDDYRNEILWTPEKPTLIQAEIELWEDGHLLDTVSSYTALRGVGIQRDRFILNGRPYYLRLVLDQGYWPDTLLTPPSDEAIRRDIELIKAMGFNGVRKHQKIEDPRFLYWADVMGLVVWGEMPSAYRFTPTAIERMTREWTEAIERDYSHPCLVVWVPFNESWGVPDLPQTASHRNYVQALYHLTKTLDPTRPVIGNDGWESAATDIIGIHDYDYNSIRLRERYKSDLKVTDVLDNKRPGGRILTLDGYPHHGQPLMLTEFGGFAYSDTEQGWGYARCKTAEQFRLSYTALLKAVSDIEIFSGFCYTQLTDTFQEMNGLLYADRTPKFPLAAIASATLAHGFQEKYVPPGSVEAGWSQADSLQPIPYCGLCGPESE